MAAPRLDAEEYSTADDYDDGGPEHAVNDVALRVDLLGNHVLIVGRVVETLERITARPRTPRLFVFLRRLIIVCPFFHADTERALPQHTTSALDVQFYVQMYNSKILQRCSTLAAHAYGPRNPRLSQLF